MKYDQLIDGQWATPVWRGYRLACCSCGLVHRINFKVSGRKLMFQAFRDSRATAAMRRKHD